MGRFGELALLQQHTTFDGKFESGMASMRTVEMLSQLPIPIQNQALA